MQEPAIFGVHDEKTLAQFRDVASRAERAALMADGHVGYVMPIGGVAAYLNQISVVGVGFDIGCGNAAIRTNLNLSAFDHRELVRVANDIEHTISFGVGRKNQADDAPVDDPLFRDAAWEAIPAEHREKLRERARQQLGTVGSGNHYVDVFANRADGTLWVGVHFGSRGFGHAVASGFLNLSQGAAWDGRAREQEVLLDLDSPLGRDYFALMNLAGRYAYVGREWVARKVVELLGGREELLVHNHHNFAWKEQHRNEETGEMLELVVVRKGATPAFPGQLSFVGGSMGDDAVIIRGAESDAPEVKALQARALFSTIHGAGRVMSRREAAGKFKGWGAKRRQVEPGKVSREMMDTWLEERGVILRGGGLDEAPQVYRRLEDVLRAQGPTIEVLYRLRPLVVVMAGANEFDPYKD